jgi:hypothetical protein
MRSDDWIGLYLAPGDIVGKLQCSDLAVSSVQRLLRCVSISRHKVWHGALLVRSTGQKLGELVVQTARAGIPCC